MKRAVSVRPEPGSNSPTNNQRKNPSNKHSKKPQDPHGPHTHTNRALLNSQRTHPPPWAPAQPSTPPTPPRITGQNRHHARSSDLDDLHATESRPSRSSLMLHQDRPPRSRGREIPPADTAEH
ncbi:hypothetical protein CEP50_07105 [Actinopolyspora mortivallis]|uniref:Uncharacterized protein n=1 Tax=Actinopolyspora mortivallis TaxID=33906 RepID=A0A2T0GXX1_ACTMO|nr:hypothetical protein CEP50_07105 [Actinopolyspora mortivallis]